MGKSRLDKINNDDDGVKNRQSKKRFPDDGDLFGELEKDVNEKIANKFTFAEVCIYKKFKYKFLIQI